MKVQGSAVLKAPREEVWRAFTDPAVLVRTIPGCERLEEIGPDRYRMTVQGGVASIKGRFAGEVSLHDQDQPESFVMTAAGAGAPGTVNADVTVTLTENGEGTTRLEYAADAIVGGMIGGVGQRMLTSAAQRTAREFFTAVDAALTTAPVAAGPAPAAGAAGEVAEPTAEPTGGAAVYEAPSPPGRTGSADFQRGLLAGAGIALLGALVGGWLAGRRRS